MTDLLLAGLVVGVEDKLEAGGCLVQVQSIFACSVALEALLHI